MAGGEAPASPHSTAAPRRTGQGRMPQEEPRGTADSLPEGAFAAGAGSGHPPGGGPMEIVKIRIRNFRSIRNMTVGFGDITIFIGANGTGKSTVLDALELVSAEKPTVEPDDYAPRSKKIEITLYARPGGHAVHNRFVHRGIVAFQRSFHKGGDAGNLQASAMCNTDFDRARGASKVPDIKEEIKRIRTAYRDFPQYTTKDEWEGNFADYEHRLSGRREHRAKYRRRYVDYGGGMALADMLKVIRVPALRDVAADGRDGVGSLLSDLMKLAVRDSPKGKRALERFDRSLKMANSLYKKEVDGMISGLGDLLSKSSELYMGDATFRIGLDDEKRRFDHPKATVRMMDNGFMAPVEQAGSGLQRVYLLSLLDAIARLRGEAVDEGQEGDRAAAPLRLVAIDEPELCQHPQRQRRILKSLIGLVRGDASIRLACSTHSPYFVELRRVDAIRLFRKGGEGVRSVTLEGLKVPMLGERRAGGPGGAERLSTWLDMNATRWVTEGFFARQVVLVEGPGDRNMLLATASAMGADLDERDVSIVPAGSVENVPKYMHLFTEFGIPVYPVWDRDRGKGKESRQHVEGEILEMLAGVGALRPAGTDSNGRCACIGDNLTAALARDLRKSTWGLWGRWRETRGPRSKRPTTHTGATKSRPSPCTTGKRNSSTAS